MAAVALADGVVTDEELVDLHRVAATLGLPESQVDRVLSGDAVPDMPALHLAGIELTPGDRVVFTGDMRVDRGEWERRARAVGLDPGSVTKATRVVVAADPDSSSGKAGKARQYGIPIVTEDAFERLVSQLETRAGTVDLSSLDMAGD